MQIKKEFNFKIGADPEFNLTLQNRKVDAHQTIEFALTGKRPFKMNRQGDGFEVNDCGNIGWDGSDSTAEIRPKPAHTPQEVIANVKEILKEAIKHINLFDMSTISEFSPIGGHIHFEVPKGERWSDEKRNTLHRKMSSFYLPILMSENKINLNIRIKQGYGSLKDHRIEKKFTYTDGTDGYTYEFRCPSAEWMTTPKLAQATLAYMAVVYHEIINKPRTFSKYSDVIYRSDKQGDALQTLAIMEFDLLTQQISNKIKKYIKNFEMYAAYKKEIDYIFSPKKIKADKAKAEYNINLGWEFTKNSQPLKRDIISSKKKFKKISANINMDEIKKVMNIHSNDDINVVLFTEAFKDRVSVFQWKLKNNYFIFGIRKGINEIIIKNFAGDFLEGKEIIKTTSDLSAVNNLFSKMKSKFTFNTRPVTQTVIDFKTGKPKNIQDSSILIGLPYDMRIKEDYKPFLESIWNIEKGIIPTKIVNKEPLISDESLEEQQKGEIYRILTTAPSNINHETVFCVDSSSRVNLINQVVNELNQGEEAPATENLKN